LGIGFALRRVGRLEQHGVQLLAPVPVTVTSPLNAVSIRSWFGAPLCGLGNKELSVDEPQQLETQKKGKREGRNEEGKEGREEEKIKKEEKKERKKNKERKRERKIRK
jgi:hypothetical protein